MPEEVLRLLIQRLRKVWPVKVKESLIESKEQILDSILLEWNILHSLDAMTCHRWRRTDGDWYSSSAKPHLTRNRHGIGKSRTFLSRSITVV